MADKPEISIIIVNWNTCDLLRDCIASIHDNGHGFEVEVIVVDNCSEDGSAGMCSLDFPEVKLICNPANLGYARANNAGMQAATGRHIMLLNPDTRLSPGMLGTMAAHLEANPGCGIAGPKIIERDGSVQGSARRFPSLRTAFFGRTSFLQKIFSKSGTAVDEIPCLSHEGDSPLPVDWVNGACMLIRDEVVKKVGLLDDDYFMYWEDADYCFRAHEAGWEVHWVPAASMLHITGASSGRSLASVVRTTVFFHKSVFRYYRKNIKPSPPALALFYVLIMGRMLMKLAVNSARAVKKSR